MDINQAKKDWLEKIIQISSSVSQAHLTPDAVTVAVAIYFGLKEIADAIKSLKIK